MNYNEEQNWRERYNSQSSKYLARNYCALISFWYSLKDKYGYSRKHKKLVRLSYLYNKEAEDTKKRRQYTEEEYRVNKYITGKIGRPTKNHTGFGKTTCFYKYTKW